jgi:hypothetical protein
MTTVIARLFDRLYRRVIGEDAPPEVQRTYAYKQGCAAYHEGETENYYSPGTQSHADWEAGWQHERRADFDIW